MTNIAMKEQSVRTGTECKQMTKREDPSSNSRLYLIAALKNTSAEALQIKQVELFCKSFTVKVSNSDSVCKTVIDMGCDSFLPSEWKKLMWLHYCCLLWNSVPLSPTFQTFFATLMTLNRVTASSNLTTLRLKMKGSSNHWLALCVTVLLIWLNLILWNW